MQSILQHSIFDAPEWVPLDPLTLAPPEGSGAFQPNPLSAYQPAPVPGAPAPGPGDDPANQYDPGNVGGTNVDPGSFNEGLPSLATLAAAGGALVNPLLGIPAFAMTKGEGLLGGVADWAGGAFSSPQASYSNPDAGLSLSSGPAPSFGFQPQAAFGNIVNSAASNNWGMGASPVSLSLSGPMGGSGSTMAGLFDGWTKPDLPVLDYELPPTSAGIGGYTTPGGHISYSSPGGSYFGAADAFGNIPGWTAADMDYFADPDYGGGIGY